MEPPNEFYVWGAYTSTRNFDLCLWENFEVAVYAGRWVWKERAKCKLCGKLVGWAGSSGNLKKHYQRNHSQNIPPPLNPPSGAPPAELLGNLAQAIATPHPIRLFGKLCINGNVVRVRKPVPEWAYFYHTCHANGKVLESHRVTCCICGKDICWGGRGLAPLKTHLNKIHFKTEAQRARTITSLTKVFGEKVSNIENVKR
jgi:hypothetical protein